MSGTLRAHLVTPIDTFGVVEELPAWCCDEDAKRLALRFYNVASANGKAEKPIPSQSILGPAVLHSFRLLKLTSTFVAILPLCIAQLSSCSAVGLSHYPWFVLFVILTFLFVATTIEWKCFSFVVIPVVQVLGGQITVFRRHVSIQTWGRWACILSIVKRTYVLTTSMYFGVILNTQTCIDMRYDVSSDFDDSWKEFMEHPLIRWCPVSKRRTLIALSWLLIFLQPAYAVIVATPLRTLRTVVEGTPFKKVYDLLHWWYSWDPNPPHPTEHKMHTSGQAFVIAYETPLPPQPPQTLPPPPPPRVDSDICSTVFSLAHANRAASVNLLRFEYTLAKVQHELDHGERSSVAPSFGLIRKEMRHLTHTLVFSALIESGLQLNVQVTSIALNRSITHKINYQLSFGVSVGLLVNVVTICCWIERVHWFWTVWKRNSDTFRDYQLKMAWLMIETCVAGCLLCFAQLYVGMKLVGSQW